ncbi:hypothetical protein TNCV_4009941 [Trichonephila clavipes]|nr:hypothetical protein TNCV_4009941 [Trichonephila clavipes]
MSEKKLSLQEVLNLLQNLLSEINDVLTDCSDEEVPANYMLEFLLDSSDDDQETELKAIHCFLENHYQNYTPFFQNTGQLRTDLWRRVLARIRHSNFFYKCSVEFKQVIPIREHPCQQISSPQPSRKTLNALDVRRLLSSHTTENIEKVSAAVRKNRVQTIAESVEISSATCQWILTNDLNMQSLCQLIAPRIRGVTYIPATPGLRGDRIPRGPKAYGYKPLEDLWGTNPDFVGAPDILRYASALHVKRRPVCRQSYKCIGG